ncbi:MAG: hypothetical protein A3J83_01440 [Elusimicrobia bacterium RIFOXYA2_FULL_40_6]|nr:MAG: hypothetical protein A3J83_01440 [Elusimicrobia bacterium RIFOXYA2_FULL_40_6]
MKSRIKIAIMLFVFNIICALSNIPESVEAIPLTLTPPSNSVFIYESKEYKCSEEEASQKQAGGNEFRYDYKVPWIDIKEFIKPEHKAQGFIDLYVVFFATNSNKSLLQPVWILYGDTDNRDDYDFRAYCDGKVYDMIDPDLKGPWYTQVAPANGNYSSGQYATLRFAVPAQIEHEYKIYLGRDNITMPTAPADNLKGTFYQCLIYTPVTSTAPIANAIVKNIAAKYEVVWVKNQYGNYVRKIDDPKYEVMANVPIVFDGSKSMAPAEGAVLTSYQWDFNDGTIETKAVPEITHTFANPGTYKIKLTVTDNFLVSSTNEGSNQVSKGNYSLPLYVNVIDQAPSVNLYQNGPNPFDTTKNKTTKIQYDLPAKSQVEIKIFTLTGRLVKTLLNEEVNPGSWEVKWDGTNDSGNKVATGVYIYSLKAGSQVQTKNLVLIK